MKEGPFCCFSLFIIPWKQKKRKMGASQKNIDFVSQKRLFPVLHRGDAVASFEDGAEIGGVPEMEGAGDFVDFAVAFRQHPDGFLEAQIQQIFCRRLLETAFPVAEEGAAGHSVPAGDLFQIERIHEVELKLGGDFPYLRFDVIRSILREKAMEHQLLEELEGQKIQAVRNRLFLRMFHESANPAQQDGDFRCHLEVPARNPLQILGENEFSVQVGGVREGNGIPRAGAVAAVLVAGQFQQDMRETVGGAGVIDEILHRFRLGAETEADLKFVLEPERSNPRRFPVAERADAKKFVGKLHEARTFRQFDSPEFHEFAFRCIRGKYIIRQAVCQMPSGSTDAASGLICEGVLSFSSA